MLDYQPGAEAPKTTSPNLTALYDLVRLLARQAAREAFATRCNSSAS